MPLPLIGRLGVGGKLTATFTATTLLTLALGGFAINGMSRMQSASSVVINDYLPSAAAVDRVGMTLEQFRVREQRLMLEPKRRRSERHAPHVSPGWTH